MTARKAEELADIGGADELRIAPQKRGVQARRAGHVSAGGVDHITSPKARSTTIRLVPMVGHWDLDRPDPRDPS